MDVDWGEAVEYLRLTDSLSLSVCRFVALGSALQMLCISIFVFVFFSVLSSMSDACDFVNVAH